MSNSPNAPLHASDLSSRSVLVASVKTHLMLEKLACTGGERVWISWTKWSTKTSALPLSRVQCVWRVYLRVLHDEADRWLVSAQWDWWTRCIKYSMADTWMLWLRAAVREHFHPRSTSQVCLVMWPVTWSNMQLKLHRRGATDSLTVYGG